MTLVFTAIFLPLENSRSNWDFFFISIEKNQDKDTNIFEKPIIHMPCVWNTFSDSDHNSNVILFRRECSVILCNDILDLMKYIFQVWSGHPVTNGKNRELTTMKTFGFGKRCLQGQIMDEVDCLMKELEIYENKPFDIQNTLNTSVSNVICSLPFGERFDYEDAIFKRLMVLVNKLFATLSISSPAFIFPFLRRLPMFKIDRVQKILGDIDAFTWEIINEHKRNFDENNINDFIDGFLQKQRGTE